MNPDILIITGMGSGLGSGHFQRMASLLVRLRDKHRLAVSMIIEPAGEAIPAELLPHVAETIASPKLIIRDKRDSATDEMEFLRRHAPVCAVDDRGPGRGRADFILDILPHPDDEATGGAVRGEFLYGYNFLKSLGSINNQVIAKTVDFVVYAGALSWPDGRDWLVSVLPRRSDWYLLGKGSPAYFARDGVRTQPNVGYAEMLLASRVAVTHFGLFLFEAHVSGCGLVTVNPTDYHSTLAETAKRGMGLTNLGVYPVKDNGAAAAALENALHSAVRTESDRDKTAARIIDSVDRCASRIRGML